MKSYIKKYRKPIILIFLLDFIGVWLGMGVPLFNIIFGFVIGFYLFNFFDQEQRNNYKTIFKFGFGSAALSFILLVMIWWPYILKLFDKSYDYLNTGIPLILYTPRASFIGWLVLMLFISPFLQLMATIFAVYLKMIKGRSNYGQE